MSLIRGFRIASQIIIILTLVGLAVVSFMVGAHTISVAEGTPHLAIMVVTGLVGSAMWWYTNRKTQDAIKSANPTNVPHDVPKTPSGKLSREEFVARLARALGAPGINEDAAADGTHMMQLNVVAAVEFKMAFGSWQQPTVGKLIDNLYQQYLRQ